MPDVRGETSLPALPSDLDQFDFAILTLVQENNQLTSQEIGDRVGLSPSAVQRRLRRLRETGVISADVSLVSPAVAGNRVVIIVEVSLEREQIQELREFERSVSGLPEVTQCYYVTGKSDFILVLNMRSMEAFNDFAERVLHSNANVKQFYTAVVMKQVKFTTRVELSTALRTS
jgi:Lrp/AsnC family leucine-responsive transcriptional regulator